MIKIQRLPEPQILRQNSDDWTNELCEARCQYYEDLGKYEKGEISNRPTRPNAKSSRYAHDEIISSLRSMFGVKCAYCESRVTHVSYQHVEHFRPQSIYPKLAYNWGNLLLACRVCNSSNKNNQFPLQDGSQPQENKNSPCSLDDTDDNTLINPCIDNPEDFFEFEDEWIVCLNDRAKKTRDVCGLNREDLIDAREFYLTLVELAAISFLAFCGDTVRRRPFLDTLKRCLAASAEYTAMIRAKLVKLGIDPEGILSLV